MTHARWAQVVRQPMDPKIVREQLAYVRGYILALEDVISDIRAARSEYHTLLAIVALNDMIDAVHKPLREARATLKTLEELDQ